MNLGHFYPSIYWKTACVSVDAGAINEEDFYNLVESGIMELTDEDDKREQSKVRYGRMATAIIKFKQYGNVALPDINTSRFGFTPDADANTIRFGLRGISRVGEQIIRDIIINRPYKSLNDFLTKMVSSDGKKLISKDKVVNLIKAGAFNQVEGKPTEQILREFVLSVSDQKKRLTLQNFQGLINHNLIPKELEFSVKVYNFTKYIRKMRFMGNYILDEKNGMRFYSQYYDMTKVRQMEVDGNYVNVINEKYWDAIYDAEMNKPRAYIKAHHDELLAQLNQQLFEEEYNKYADGDQLQWELDSLNFYYNGHPLSKVELPVEVTPVGNLMENEFDGFWMIKGKQVPKHMLRTIMGTVIDKDKTKGLVTLQTVDGGVIDIKVFKQQFARYSHVITSEDAEGEKDILEDSFFEKGTHLVVTGILRGEVFVPKVYKNTGFDAILKVVLNSDGTLKGLLRKSE
jgi:DNA polymerase-3 subunit alpha